LLGILELALATKGASESDPVHFPKGSRTPIRGPPNRTEVPERIFQSDSFSATSKKFEKKFDVEADVRFTSHRQEFLLAGSERGVAWFLFGIPESPLLPR
jgi:hypothetical protein